MSHQNTRITWSWAISITGIACLTPLGAGQEPIVQPPAQSQQRLDWSEQFDRFLEIVVFLMGGNPDVIRKAGTMPEKAAAFCGFVNSNTLPSGPADRTSLAESVDEAYCLLQSNPGEIDPVSRALFMSALELIWTQLGLPPSELGC